MADQTTDGGDRAQLDKFKEYLAEPRYRIKLDDLVTGNVRTALKQTADDKAPFNAQVANGQDVAERLRAYEDAVRPLLANAALLGRWATPDQRATLSSMMARMTDHCVKPLGGSTLLLAMRWYPLSLLTYAAGIAALSSDNYAAFAVVHTKRIEVPTRRRGESAPIIVPVVDAMLELAQTNAWQSIPGNNRTFTPESDYLLKTLHPVLDDLLFLGGGAEQLFDRYEMMRALVYTDLTDGSWAPIGRFGTKHSRSMGDGSPYLALRAEAGQYRDQWEPIRHGLFGGSYPRFEQVAKKFEDVLNKVSRY